MHPKHPRPWRLLLWWAVFSLALQFLFAWHDAALTTVCRL